MCDAGHQAGPPRPALWLLRRTCPLRLAEAVEGDLTEGYRRRRERQGRWRAALWFWREAVLFSLWHGWVRESTYSHVWGPIMWKNHLRIAWRTLRKHKGYSAISIVGLSLAVACSLLVGLYVRNEFAVNEHFDGIDRIYRIDSDWRDEAAGLSFTTLAPVAETLVNTYPEVVAGVRMYLMTNHLRVGERGVRREVMMADPSVLELFGLPMLHGDPATALQRPRSVVVTDSLAMTLFGMTDVVGRTIYFETWQAGEQPYTVTGVRKALPYNSVTYVGDPPQRHAAIVSPQSYDFFRPAGWNSWHSRYILQYVKLAPGADPGALQAKLDGFIEAHAPDVFHDVLSIRLNPLRTLHVTGFYNRGQRVIGVLVALAVVLLLIACINFTNLATARALSRGREVGVRKAVGAGRGQLVLQFLGEAGLIAVGATLLAVALAAIGLRPFFELAGATLVLPAPWDGTTLAALLLLTLVTTLLAGLYPALVLARFDPLRALHGALRLSRRHVGLRRGLVVVQFAGAVVLLVALITIVRQMSFIASSDLGFDRENILVIDSMPRDFSPAGVERMQTVKERLLAVPGVQAASLSWRTAADGGSTVALHAPNQSPDQALSATMAVVDDDFLTTYGLRLKAGRFFDESRPADRDGVVLNETAMRLLGWEATDGKALVIWHAARPVAGVDPPPAVPVIGVVEDYHFNSLHEPLRPLVLLSVRADTMYRVLALRLAGGEVGTTLQRVEAAWNAVWPGVPFVFTFLDDQVAQAYRAEHRLRRIVEAGAGLALVIACLGMFGMAALSVTQRTKEIGVRKVLGATAGQIWLLLTRDFLRPVTLAVLVALPVGYLLVQRWLAGFAYRIDVSLWMLAGVAAIALLVAGLAVSYQTVNASRTDPATSLRYE